MLSEEQIKELAYKLFLAGNADLPIEYFEHVYEYELKAYEVANIRLEQEKQARIEKEQEKFALKNKK